LGKKKKKKKKKKKFGKKKGMKFNGAPLEVLGTISPEKFKGPETFFQRANAPPKSIDLLRFLTSIRRYYSLMSNESVFRFFLKAHQEIRARFFKELKNQGKTISSEYAPVG